MSLTPEQIADVIRIVESAEFFSRCHGDWQQRTLRVPREQPDASPPSEGKSAEAKCTRKVLEWLGQQPKCTCKCRWESHAGYASIEQVDPACPLHGRDRPGQPASAEELAAKHGFTPHGRTAAQAMGAVDSFAGPASAEPAAEDDEAWRIAVSQCHTRYNALRCAEDIRTLVASKLRTALAFVEAIGPLVGDAWRARQRAETKIKAMIASCADAIEREGGKGR